MPWTPILKDSDIIALGINSCTVWTNAVFGAGAYSGNIYQCFFIDDDNSYRIVVFDGSDYSFGGTLPIAGNYVPTKLVVDPSNGNIYAGYGKYPNNLYVTIYVSTDGGQSFAPSTFDSLTNNSTTFVNFDIDYTNEYIYAADQTYVLWKMPFGGDTWVLASTGTPVNNFGMMTALCVDSSNGYVWIAGRDTVTAGNPPMIEYTSDGGSTWNDATGDYNSVNTTGEIGFIYVYDGKVTVTGSSEGDSGLLAVHSENGGTNWTTRYSDTGNEVDYNPWLDPPPYYAGDIDGYQNQVIIVDNNNGLWNSTDNGATWAPDEVFRTDDVSVDWVEYYGVFATVNQDASEVLFTTFLNNDTESTGVTYYYQSSGSFVPHAISGTITRDGSPLAGVTVQYDTLPDQTTDEFGSFSFYLSSLNEAYLTPSLTDHIFTLSTIFVNDSPTDVTGLDFTATHLYPVTVTVLDSSGDGVSGYGVVNNDGSVAYTTDVNGEVIIMLSDGNYTFNLRKLGWTASPGSVSFEINGSGLSLGIVAVERLGVVSDAALEARWYKNDVLVQSVSGVDSTIFTRYNIFDFDPGSVYRMELWYVAHPGEPFWSMPEFIAYPPDETSVLISIL